jgi:hypothetical protein
MNRTSAAARTQSKHKGTIISLTALRPLSSNKAIVYLQRTDIQRQIRAEKATFKSHKFQFPFININFVRNLI